MKKPLLLITAVLFHLVSLAQLPSGQSLNFDGVNEFIQTNFNGIGGAAARTIEAWIKPGAYSGTGGNQRVIFDYGSMTPLGSRYTGAVQLSTRILRSEVGGNGQNGTTSMVDQKWHHIVTVYNPAATNKVITYVDGSQNFSGNYTLTINSLSTVKFRIGMRNDGANSFLGEIDEVRVWNDVRTPTELVENMFRELTGSEAGLVAYFNMDGSTNVAGGIQDVSGSNNGTMMNMEAGDIINQSAPVSLNTALNDVLGVWNSISGNSSDGLIIATTSALAAGNNLSFGHDNAGSGQTTSDVPVGVTTRFDQSWEIDVNGTLNTAMIFKLSTISNNAITSGTAAADYVLLYRATPTGPFTNLGTANSIANTDEVLFNGIAMNDGYYTLGFVLATPTPVELLMFNANLIDSKVYLKWRTVEKNVEQYLVQKSNHNSINGQVNFSNFITIEAQNGSLNNYQVMDKDPRLGKNYYRFIAVDQDGSKTYSNVLSIDFNIASDLSIYPNPSSNYFFINGPSIELQSLKIINALGQDISNRVTIEKTNSTNYIIHTTLASGTYFVISTKYKKAFTVR